jgi:replicative DNA helicase
MRSRDNREVIGVDTGFRTLNKMTTGFNNGDLIIVAARPSMGKTAFSLNMVYSALKTDSGVAFFSLEMPVEQLMLRLLSIDSLVELQKLRTGDLTDNEYSRLNQSIKNFSTKKLFIDDDGGLNINQLRTKLRKLKSKNPEISMAVVDYIQIMNSTNSKDRQAEISEISRGLKLLARELKIPIIALSQLNRSLESRNDKRPIMSDIRESGAIEQDADIILFIYRDDVYRLKAEKEKEMEARNRGEKFVSQEVVKTHEIAEIIIAKQRNGPTGVIKLNFHKSLTQFLEIENVNFDAEAQQPTRINMISDVQNIEPFDNVSDVDEASMPVF